MRALLLSPYDAASHRQWRQRLVEGFADWDWTELTLPPRHFAWRIRGNSLTFSQGRHADTLRQDYDLVVATSMCDLSALRGLVPELAAAPRTVVYFHENQFAYPASARQRDDVGPAVVNLYAALCADAIGFNSDYNRRSFLDGVADFLGRMPDAVPEGIVETLAARASVVAVPLDAAAFAAGPARATGPLRIVWNHRWEYDKGPERFFAALFALAERGVDFEVIVAGQRFRRAPPIFEQARERLGRRVRHWGFVEARADYLALLAAGDVVVSTALHDFQGLSVLEAMAAGCLPLVADRLAYPEYVPRRWRYASTPDDPAAEAAALADRLAALAGDLAATRATAPADVSRFRWDHLEPRWRGLLAPK